ncbi:MAG: hypothetical protein ACOX6D_03645 [Thermoguttaceae bacterium]
MSSILELDYPLLKACLESRPGGWKDFVDRFLGLVLHTIDQTAHCNRITLTREERSDLCESIFRALWHNDKELLRKFNYTSSVSTYLAVVVRRVVVTFLAAAE